MANKKKWIIISKYQGKVKTEELLKTLTALILNNKLLLTGRNSQNE